MALKLNKSSGKQAPKSYRVSEDLKITKQQYLDLVKYLNERLDLAKTIRDGRVEIMEYIDKEYYGYLKRDPEDRKRQRQNKQGKGVKPTDEKLSMLFSQIDEAVTFLLSVLAPDEALYNAQAPVSQQKIADGLATLMNEHAEQFGHIRHLSMFLLDCMKYNLGAFGVEWLHEYGNAVQSTQAGAPKVQKNVEIAYGNAIRAFDMYNLLLDPSCDPIDLPTRGEFFGYVELETPFRLRVKAANYALVNVDQFLKECKSNESYYFRGHPQVRSDFSTNEETNWSTILSAGALSGIETAQGYECVKMYAFIVPAQFGLGKSEEYEMWRFYLGSNKHILKAEAANLAHGMLPINIAMPFEDHFKLQAKSVSERLIGYQNFGSFVLNTHQRAVRKKLYGLTIYDKNTIPLMDQDDVDLAGGKIPAQNLGNGEVDLRKRIIQFTDGPNTDATLQNIDYLEKLMQKILPTNILQQVAGLERATQYQAASLVQGANRRNLKIAKIINSQAMNRGRHMQFLNILVEQKNVKVLAPDGTLVDIDVATLRNTNMKFMISDGLKGLDRLALMMNMKEMFASLLQSSQAIQQVDVVKLMDYLSTMFGDYTDFEQFRLQSPMDALPADQRNLAYQLLQAYSEQQKNAAPAPGETLPQ